MEDSPAHEVVANAVLAKPQAERASFARLIIAYAVGLLVSLCGHRAVSEELYRIADGLVRKR